MQSGQCLPEASSSSQGTPQRKAELRVVRGESGFGDTAHPHTAPPVLRCARGSPTDGSGEGLTEHHQSGHGCGEVACAWDRSSADIDTRVVHFHIGDHEVPVAQHAGVEDVDGLVVCRGRESSEGRPCPTPGGLLPGRRRWRPDSPKRLQETMGLGCPVAMHSKTTVW